MPVLAGTDLGALLTYPGFSLHDELQALVENVGLTPAEALRAATSAPAHFFKATDWGRIAPGQRADIVLLTGDPLEDSRIPDGFWASSATEGTTTTLRSKGCCARRVGGAWPGTLRRGPSAE